MIHCTRVRLTALLAGLAASAAAYAQPFQIVTNLPGSFTDISATGTLITTGDDSSVAFISSVTNALVTTPNVFACTNGNITSTVFATFTNAPLPQAPSFGLYPFWDDLFVTAGVGSVSHQSVVEGGINVEIVQWTNAGLFENPAVTGTFQVKIFGSGPVLAQYIYQDVNYPGTTSSNGASATIGVQWPTNQFFQHSFNSPVIQNGAVLSVVGATGGACCLLDGTCELRTQTSCAASNGIYRGDNSPCATANCPQPATGACCLTSGCSVLTALQCTAQNGTYRGDNTTCASAGCPVPCPPITGQFVTGTPSWPVVHTTIPGPRLFRDGVPDTCAAPGTAAPSGAGPYNCDVYDFINTSASPTCVVFTLTSTGNCNVYGGAYIGGFNPTNVTLNNVASTGNSTGIPPNPIGMSFTVPGNTTFQIVINDANSVAVSTCASTYTFQLSGGQFNCTPVSCYPNCDHSTSSPCLTVQDFGCFLNAFAAGDTYANCDGSTTIPVLTVQDFGCFLNSFAAGCGTNC
jgi:hypothetical protein